jgi:RimJ/RimL family protein N-acetyltransferase
MIIAESERLILRRWQPLDREPFARLNADPRVMEHFPAPLTAEESGQAVDRIEAHFTERGFGLCAAELRETREFIGFIGLSRPRLVAHFTPCVEIGWRLASDYWGRGLATEGAGEMLRYGFEHLALDEIVSFTVAANLRSRRVMEKLGMIRDSADDFDDPGLPPGHPMRRHVLYRLKGREWRRGLAE